MLKNLRFFFNILMLFTEYPYKFVKVLKHQTATEKETITLLCELDDAEGEVKWFKGEQEILSDKRFLSIYCKKNNKSVFDGTIQMM